MICKNLIFIFFFNKYNYYIKYKKKFLLTIEKNVTIFHFFQSKKMNKISQHCLIVKFIFFVKFNLLFYSKKMFKNFIIYTYTI